MLKMSETKFANRRAAGELLAQKLMHLEGEQPVVLGLARGGVEVAAPIAEALQAPLEVFVARKLGAPGQSELGIGAVAPGGVRILDDRLIERLGISEIDLDRITARELEEVERRLAAYRGDQKPVELSGRVAILVDDGLATGVSAKAAVRSLRLQNPSRIVLAVPVCSESGVALLEAEADDVICSSMPELFYAVGLWYEDFGQTSDATVLRLLDEARTRRSTNEPAGN
jgi:putative phosphoribosyl transferase